MAEKIIEIDNLYDKEFVRFYTKDSSIDFTHHSITTRVLNNITKELIEAFDIPNYVHDRNNPQSKAFNYDIPANINSLKFVFSSNSTPVNLIEAVAFPV